MDKVFVGDLELTEAEKAALVDALDLYAAVCHGQIDQIGDVLCKEFTARKDIDHDFRHRVKAVRDLFRQAHTKLHDSTDFKARWSPSQDAVPTPGVRAHQIASRIRQDAAAVRQGEDDIRTQAEMADPQE